MYSLFKKAFNMEPSPRGSALRWVPVLIKLAAVLALVGAVYMLVEGAKSFNKKALDAQYISHEKGRLILQKVRREIGEDELKELYGSNLATHPVSIQGFPTAWLEPLPGVQAPFRLVTSEELMACPDWATESSDEAPTLPILHLARMEVAEPNRIKMTATGYAYHRLGANLQKQELGSMILYLEHKNGMLSDQIVSHRYD